MLGKIAVSNIAWDGDEDAFFTVLSKAGANGVEVAPGKISPWERMNASIMCDYRRKCEGYGLSIPSFQAFLFGKPHLQLLGNQSVFDEFSLHLQFVAQLASVAGAKILVFGAPKNRLLLGMDQAGATDLATERLSTLAKIAWDNGVSIGLEAVPACYAGEFIVSYLESLEIVSKVDHPGLVFHFDTGCTFLNEEDVSSAILESSGEIRSFHVTQPELADFSSPALYHLGAADALRRTGYDGWINIEMKPTLNASFSISNAVDYVSCTYN